MENTFKNFKKVGNRYILKRQYGFGILIVTGLAVMAWVGYNSDNKAMMWIFGIFAAICFLSIYTERMVIDLDAKTLFIKRGLKAEISIPFSDIGHYQMSRLIYIFIPVNTSLNVCYFTAGEEKFAIVAQGLSKRAMQDILNDIEAITLPYAGK
ncbi:MULTISPECIES: hypothetical protein [unclassified Chryseobacterium]|uniref:hypothetical protein n=1 Tax=unclassified Chryseobacterium TaxID=2593645 RepID=UPI0011580A24|nr:hypothetical protein [Chryseobacterium sp. ON_d1]GEJ45963.1 hypothetical protein CRS_25710 [Chryseobacterium sp. ON_d1]